MKKFTSLFLALALLIAPTFAVVRQADARERAPEAARQSQKNASLSTTLGTSGAAFLANTNNQEGISLDEQNLLNDNQTLVGCTDPDGSVYIFFKRALPNKAADCVDLTQEELDAYMADAANDTTLPVISDVMVTENEDGTVMISWYTDELTWTKLMYGTDESYGTTKGKVVYSTYHHVTLSGLSADTEYHYQIIAKDLGGNEAMSEDYSFGETAAVLPIVSNVQVIDIANTSATITWSTDVASDSMVSFGLDESYGSTASDAALVTEHSVAVSGLSAETLYHFVVSSTDAEGDIGMGVDGTFTTTL